MGKKSKKKRKLSSLRAPLNNQQQKKKKNGKSNKNKNNYKKKGGKPKPLLALNTQQRSPTVKMIKHPKIPHSPLVLAENVQLEDDELPPPFALNSSSSSSSSSTTTTTTTKTMTSTAKFTSLEKNEMKKNASNGQNGRSPLIKNKKLLLLNPKDNNNNKSKIFSQNNNNNNITINRSRSGSSSSSSSLSPTSRNGSSSSPKLGMQQPVKPMLINGKKAPFSSSSARKVVEFHEMEIEDTMKRNEGIGHAILGDDPLVESEQNGKKLFEWLIHPVSANNFYNTYWEKKPMYIKRDQSKDYYNGWFSSNELLKMVHAGKFKYAVDIDITMYKNGQRYTPSNGDTMQGKVATVDKIKTMMKKEDCSVRILSPQRYSDKIWRLLAGLETFWNYGAGCNIYYTPAGTQGFAPHYDDIEAFIIQLEGQKRWRMYKPVDRLGGTLPRMSSGNFDQNQIGEPVLDIILSPGDMLYFPRGWIHQAVSVSGNKDASLHATISTAQNHSWGDYFQILLPQLAQQAFEDHHDIRKALPRGYQNYMGIIHSEEEHNAAIMANRQQFQQKAVELFMKAMESMNLDRAADAMSIRYLHDRMPTVLSKKEKKNMQSVTMNSTLSPKSKVRLLRGPTMFRLTVEDDAAYLYYSCYNSRLYHEKEPQGVEFDVDVAPAIEHLLKTYPEPVKVGEDWGVWGISGLNLSDNEKVQEQIRICNVLYQNHLMVKL